MDWIAVTANLIVLAVVVLAGIVLFGLLRSLVLWYFRIPEQIDLQRRQVANQERIIYLLERSQQAPPAPHPLTAQRKESAGRRTFDLA